MAPARRLGAAFDSVFDGAVPSWIYGALRIGFAMIVLVRHSDWLRPIAALEHHRFVHGLDFWWTSPSPPWLVSPLVPGLVLGPALTDALVVARTVLAVLLLVGVRSSVVAALLAATSYAVFASDRYHYYHHLHLLYVTLGWLSLCPLDDAFSLERRLRPRAPCPSPVWPLQLLRAFTVSTYLASGVAKLNGTWTSGEVLAALAERHVLAGGALRVATELVGFRGIAWLVCAAELGLPLLLLHRATRRPAVVALWLLHALIGMTMNVFTFGAQMALLGLAFWPERQAAA